MNVASGLLIIRNGNPLAVYDPERGWGLPAGKSEPGETPTETAVRECFEETGLRVPESSLKFLYSGPVPDQDISIPTFWAPDPGGELVHSPDGVPAFVAWETLLKGPFTEYNDNVRKAAFDRIPELWVHEYGSGTLRRALQQGMSWFKLYLHERTAMEFGYEFHLVEKSRIMEGIPLAEGDDPATTETCWHARALAYKSNLGNLGRKYRVVWARVSDEEESREGLAIICECSVQPHWVPQSKVIMAFTTDRDGKTLNPC